MFDSFFDHQSQVVAGPARVKDAVRASEPSRKIATPKEPFECSLAQMVISGREDAPLPAK